MRMEAQDHRLKEWREKRGLKIREAADGVGCSRQAWFRYENGRMPVQPFLDRIIIIAGGDVTANDWLGKEAADVVAKRQASA